MKSFNSELKDSIVIITGICGFLGKQTALCAAREGADLIGFDIMPKPSLPLQKLVSDKRLQYFYGDFSSFSSQVVTALRSDKKPQAVYVIHLGGMANVSDCEENPSLAFAANVNFTFQVAELCRAISADTLIFPSTGHVYKSNITTGISEQDPVAATNIYTLTKLTSELLVTNHSTTYGYRGIVVRLSNVYGWDSRESTVLGKIISQARIGQSITVQDRTPVRDFIFVNDVVSGLFRLLQMDTGAIKIFNISSGYGVSIGYLVDLTEYLLYKNRSEPLPYTEHPKSTSTLILDNTLVESVTGWKPKISIQKGIKMCLNEKGATKE
jgi:nucleoside-diphosphate-sugar epimerase